MGSSSPTLDSSRGHRRHRREPRGPPSARSGTRAASARHPGAPSRSRGGTRGRRRGRRCHRRPRPRSHRPAARSAMCSVAYPRWVGVEYAHWLLSHTNTIGSRRTPAMFIASWASPRAAAPSPNQPTATRCSSRIRNASAQPTATGKYRREVADHRDHPDSLSRRYGCCRPCRGGAVCTAHVVERSAPGLEAAHDVHAQVAVERGADIVGLHRRCDPDRRGFVAASRVEPAGDLALLVEDVPALLEPPGDQHVAVDRPAGPRGRGPPP